MSETNIVIVGEAPGEQEAKIGQSFVGPSGIELLRMLNESRIIRLSPFDLDYIRKYWSTNNPESIAAIWDLHPEIHRTNVFRQHPPRNDLAYFCGPKSTAIPGYPTLLKSQFVREEFQDDLDQLATEINAHNPNVVLCLGNSALWALAGRTGITKLRGTTLLSTHCVADYKLLPTYHPAAVLRQWELRPTTIADLMKAKRESAYADIRRPQREIWIEPSLEDIKLFISTHIMGCRLLSVDIETSGSRITCIGFSPSPSLALVIPFDDERTKSGNYWPTREDETTVWGIIRGVLESVTIPKLFQNGLFDIAFLWRSMKIKVLGAAEDTMLLQHSLQPEALKGLGYLGSIYSDQGEWKTMRKKNETIKRDS